MAISWWCLCHMPYSSQLKAVVPHHHTIANMYVALQFKKCATKRVTLLLKVAFVCIEVNPSLC